ncbi:MAG: hypothetical protein K9N23_02280 [Akkermansiaceae bacterium]|nr:hypothetical protein [Akkermansiaceae bacterium]
MLTSFQDSLSHLTTRMVDLLWHQWSSIGVAGYPRPGDDWIIDPEALLLATTRFGRHDSRLMDESIDWLAKFGRRISLQRLQGLHRSWPGVADSRVLAAIAEVLGQQVAHRKWRVIADRAPAASEPESLFLRSDGTPAAHFGEAAPAFAKHGLLRGKLELRGMSQPPNPRARENLLFTLRALLGVNARAEILAWLLTHDSGHPAAIARSTGYFSKSIQQILNEMEESGQVLSVRHGREKHFRVHTVDWHFLLPPPPAGRSAFPRWVDWMPLFAAIIRFAETLALPGIDDKSDHFQASKLREALDEAMPALVRAGVAHELHSSRNLRGADLVQSLLADLDSLLG